MANFTPKEAAGVMKLFIGLGSGKNVKPISDALNSLLTKSIEVNREATLSRGRNALFNGAIPSTKEALSLLNAVDKKLEAQQTINANKRSRSTKSNDPIPSAPSRRATR
jgi:hypothetical protein